ncbi:unnamed protein product [Phytomonas sp. Hart1]|nr:unnamed protein product [Phytomonas sp. Hart1]|eukprot:CCW67663.1 unnamed protein product [Phytomonas sp. isolate Hart1]
MSLITKVAAAMEKIAPLALADSSWDNVGILVESPQSNHTYVVMLTIDLTPQVLEECVGKKVEVILAYHPPIFKPMRRLLLRDAKTNIILRAVREGMSIYSPHTALDAVQGGINDWLLSSSVGEVANRAPIVAKAADGSGSAETGYGRVSTLAAPILLHKIVENVKKKLEISTVRVALPASWTLTHPIQSIAVCAGSGSSVFAGLTRPVDLLLTGEMGHHEVLAANAMNRAVILCEHTNTERGYLKKVLLPRLRAELGGEITFHVSEEDRDPLVTW